MTTFIIFSGTADGKADSANSVYLTARAGPATSVDTTTANNITFGQQEFFGYDCLESFVGFDTSVVGSAPISSALLSFVAQGGSTLNFTANARLFNWGPTLTVSDWVAGASLSAQTLLASRDLTVAGWKLESYNDFVSDANFVSNINTTGITYMVISSSRTEAGTAPGVGTFESVTAYTADQTGTAQDPRLIVTTSDFGSFASPAIRTPNPFVGPMSLRNHLRAKLVQTWRNVTTAAGATPAIAPAEIDAISTVSAEIQELGAVTPGTISATSTMTAEIQELAAISSASISSVSTVTASITAQQAITPTTINATATVSASITANTPILPATINSTATVSAEVQELAAVTPTTINSVSTVGSEIQELAAITPAQITSTSTVTATVSKVGGVVTTAPVAFPFVVLVWSEE